MSLTREKLLMLFAAVLLVPVYTWTGIRDEIAGLVADDAVYLLMAESTKAWLWGDAPRHAFIWDFTKFPPLYPFLLAVFGAGPGSLSAAHWVTTVVTLAGLFLFWLYLQHSVGRTAATLLALFLGLLPGVLKLGLNLWSEHLYLLLTMALFVAHERISRRRPGGSGQSGVDSSLVSGMLGLPALMALLCLTRTIGLAMVAAWVLRCLRLRCWRPAVAGGLSVAPLIAWRLYRPGEQLDPYSRYAGLWTEKYDIHSLYGITEAIWTQISRQSASLVEGFSEFVFGAAQPALLAISAVLLLAVVGSAALRAYRNELDGCYVLVYLLVVLLWPNYDHGTRFLYPVFPFVILNGVFIGRSIHSLTAKAPASRLHRTLARGAPVFLLLPFLIIGPPTGTMLSRVLQGDQQGLGGFSRTLQWVESRDAATALNNVYMLRNIMDAFRQLDSRVPKQGCVYSVHQELLMLYGNRLSFTPVPKAFDFYLSSESRPCDYFMVLWTSSHPFLPPGYPTAYDGFSAEKIRNFRLDGDADQQVFASLYRLD